MFTEDMNKTNYSNGATSFHKEKHMTANMGGKKGRFSGARGSVRFCAFFLGAGPYTTIVLSSSHYRRLLTSCFAAQCRITAKLITTRSLVTSGGLACRSRVIL